MTDFNNKKVIVFGLGASGTCAARLLAKKGAIVKVTESSTGKAIETRAESLSEIGIECEIGKHTKKFCRDSDMAILSPGIDSRFLYGRGIIPAGCEVMGELELGYLFCPAPIIAITGTNGKSTTTKLIGKILSDAGMHAVICGNIGNPLTGEIDILTKKSIAVVEVSSFQLEAVKNFKPYISVLLNITDDHYERHYSYDKYKLEKFKIFKNQTKEDWAVLFSDFKKDFLSKRLKSKVVFYDNRDLKKIDFDLEKIDIKGIHNLDNIACALKVARIFKVDKKSIKNSIETFRGLAHRFEKVDTFKGVDFIDDSKATNVDSAKRALESVSKKVILIAGGVDKGGDYSVIIPMVSQKVDAMVLIGKATKIMKKVFSPVTEVLTAKNMDEAVKLSFKKANKGQTIFLSPMCSSFDMYSSYKERVNDFRESVKGLKEIIKIQEKI